MAEPLASNGRPVGTVSMLSEHDRRRLLAAVVAPFVSEGYRATSIESICRASGIDRQLFSHLFAGTEDCFLQAFDQIVSETREEIEAAVPARAAWPDQLATAVQVVLGLIDANPGPSRLVLVQAARATDSILHHYFELIASLEPFFAEGRRYTDRQLPDMLDSTLIGGAGYMLGAHLAAERPAPLATLFPELFRLLALPYFEEDEIDELIVSQRLPSATRPE
jgi:AcrR family transcriptional regulator